MSNFRALLFQFYKMFLFWNLLITVVAIYAVQIGGPGNTASSIIIKMIGYFGAFAFQTYFYKYTYFYYRNAGQSVKRLYICAFAIDFLIYLAILGFYIIVIIDAHAKS